MKSQKNLDKFFSRGDTPYIIGTSLLLVAFFGLLIGRSYSYWIGLAATPVGLVMFFIGSIGRVGQEDIDNAVAGLLWEYNKPLLEDVRLARRADRHTEILKISQYDYEGEGLLSRRGKDGVWRTSRHTAATIMFLNDGLAYITRMVFPLEDNLTSNKSVTRSGEIKFEDIGKAEIVRDTVRLKDIKRTCEVVRARLVITSRSGESLLSLQVNDDLDADTLADTINRAAAHG